MDERATTTEFRFWSKVDKGVSKTDCWEWLGTHNGVGYGMLWDFRRGKWRKILAHRIAYELHHGVRLPAGQRIVIQHSCDNPGCVNPRHLVRGSMLTNAQDMAAKGRRRTVRTENSTNPPRFEGSQHPEAKMTEKQVVQYRKQLAAGKPLRQLARETGLSRKTLMCMRDRVTWKHVP